MSGPETAGWGGGLPLKGVVVEKLVPSLESLSCLGLEGRTPGRPGNFAGMSRTPAGVRKLGGRFDIFYFFPFGGGGKGGGVPRRWLGGSVLIKNRARGGFQGGGVGGGRRWGNVCGGGRRGGGANFFFRRAASQAHFF